MSRESAQRASASTTVGTREAASTPCTNSVTPRAPAEARADGQTAHALQPGLYLRQGLGREAACASPCRGKGMASSFFTAGADVVDAPARRARHQARPRHRTAEREAKLGAPV